MEEKVHGMLQLIEGDGDSFAKRAEMYYRRRPSSSGPWRSPTRCSAPWPTATTSYRKISKMQTTPLRRSSPSRSSLGWRTTTTKIPDNFVVLEMNMSKIPQVPKAPIRDLKTIISKASKQVQAKKMKAAHTRQMSIVESGLTKEEAVEEINKLQKETMKEFVKRVGLVSIGGLRAKQQRILRLQDEFSMDIVIEDDEARTLMAEAALKSCQETLAMLQEKTAFEAMDEYERIEAACEHLQPRANRWCTE